METEIRNIVTGLVGRIKSYIELKDTGQMASLLGNIPLWLFDRPGSAADLVDRFEQISDGSDDAEFLFLKVLTLEQTGCNASLSALTQLVWTNEKTWEEEEFDAVMHMGMVRQDSRWLFDYLGFTHQKPAWSQIPAVNTAAAIRNPFQIHDDTHATATYFGMASASPYLAYPVQGAGHAFKADVPEPETDTSVPPGFIPIYVPESVLIAILEKKNITNGLKRES